MTAIKRNQQNHTPAQPLTAALYFFATFGRRARARYLARSKSQPSTKCEFSEAKLRPPSCADVDYGERGDIDDVDNFAPEVINEVLSKSLVGSARRQLNAVKGTSQQIEWYVSSDLAKRGIEQLLKTEDLKGITITVKAP